MAAGPLRVLIVENQSEDVELILDALRSAGFEPDWRREETEKGFLAALEDPPDVILCDYPLPQFDALVALDILQEGEVQVPLIIISGTIEEEVAMAAMRRGAADYLPRDRLGRLGRAVTQAIEQRRLREQWEGVERALGEAEAKYRGSFENAVEGIFRMTLDGRYLTANPALARMLGFGSPEALMAEDGDFQDLCVEPHLAEERIRLLEVKGAVTGLEYQVRRRDGEVIWVSENVRAVRDWDGRPIGAEGTLVEITERKRAEQERDTLLARLVAAQEAERARIAADIHDDSIQVMTAVELRLQTLRRRLTGSEETSDLKRLEEAVQSAIARLRHLLFELHPLALEEEGLVPALRLYLNQMRVQAGIECRLEDRLEREPPPEVRTILYRVAQEALTNVRKHAHARRVEVTLEPRDDGLSLRIRDDGSGFTLAEAEARLPGHLGLTSMRERVEMANGWCGIESTPGVGTTVEFWIPRST